MKCDGLLGTYSWKSYVERGFSLNKRLVTADHACLGEETVNAVRLIKDVIANSCEVLEETRYVAQNARSGFKYNTF